MNSSTWFRLYLSFHHILHFPGMSVLPVLRDFCRLSTFCPYKQKKKLMDVCVCGVGNDNNNTHKKNMPFQNVQFKTLLQHAESPRRFRQVSNHIFVGSVKAGGSIWTCLKNKGPFLGLTKIWNKIRNKWSHSWAMSHSKWLSSELLVRFLSPMHVQLAMCLSAVSARRSQLQWADYHLHRSSYNVSKHLSINYI